MSPDACAPLASLATLVRAHDPDRYFCALFAPAAHRETLFTLYAFNHELARACEVTREPGLALIRLQWWREVVEGARRAHEVATPLRAALASGALQAETLLAMLDARETEAEADFPTLVSWCAWLERGAGSLAVAAAQALGAPPGGLGRMRDLGTGYGMAGQLRNVPALAAAGRCLLPQDVLAQHGLSVDAVLSGVPPAALQPALAALAEASLARLGPAEACGRAWIAAGLPAVFARRDLRRVSPPARMRGLGDRAAAARSAVRARC